MYLPACTQTDYCPSTTYACSELDPLFPYYLATKWADELCKDRKLHQVSKSIVSNLPAVTDFLGYLLNLACACLCFPTASGVWQAGTTNWVPWWHGLCLCPGSTTCRESSGPAKQTWWRTHRECLSHKRPQNVLENLVVSHWWWMPLTGMGSRRAELGSLSAS